MSSKKVFIDKINQLFTHMTDITNGTNDFESTRSELHKIT